MYLARLEIQGFKSFASSLQLDFQRGITAIVGPNGSGKSNVADAIRWVLGEQSLKLLRGKRSDDVIFAGSDKRSRLGMAEASLIINNADGGAPIDYSEIVITRRVYRDGEGEYLINRQPARLQDIQLLLARANFGQRTYSVIGQGMIDSFLISNPQERKHLFDEAAGVRQYQLKKDQALQKLALSKENLAQGEAIMVEIEPRLRTLTRQVRRLERREEIERQLCDAQTRYFGRRWQDIDGEHQELDTEYAEHERQRAAVAKELEAIQHELEQIERERSASETFGALQKHYNAILDEKNRLLERQAVVKGQLEVAAKRAGAGETAFLERRAHELRRNLRQLHEERAALAQAITRHQGSLAKDRVNLQTVEQEFQDLEMKLGQLQAQWQEQVTVPEIQQSVAAFGAKYDAFVHDLHAQETLNPTTVRSQARRLQAELEKIHRRLSAAHLTTDPKQLAAVQQQLVDAAERRQARLRTVMQLQTDLRLVEQQDAQLAQQEGKLTTEVGGLQHEASIQELAKTNPDAAYAAYVDQAKNIDRELGGIDQRLNAARQEINGFNTIETTKKERLFALQKEFRSTQHQLNAATHAVNDRQVKLARVEQRLDDLKHELTQTMGDDALRAVAQAAEAKLEGDITLLAEEIGRLTKQLQLIGGIEETVTTEYTATNARWEFLSQQAADLKAGIGSLEKAIAELDDIITEKFNAAFKKINNEFHSYFRTLFRGGRAELVLVKEVLRPDDDLTEAESAMAEANGEAKPEPKPVKDEDKVVTGIDIKATPPGKKLQSITMLSGGERALTSIALLCAIISNNPSPFVVIDEVDAALDEANSQRFAAILEQLAHKTQFITITHNRATMEKAGILYGVTMGDDGVSQLLSVKMDQVEEIIKSYGNR